MSSLFSFLCSNTVSVRATPRSALTVEIELQRPRHPPRQAIQFGHGSLSLDKVAERVGLAILPSRTCAPLFLARPPSTPAPCLASPPTMAAQRTSSGEIAGSWSSTGRESGKASFRLLRSATLFLSGKAISCLCPCKLGSIIDHSLPLPS